MHNLSPDKKKPQAGERGAGKIFENNNNNNPFLCNGNVEEALWSQLQKAVIARNNAEISYLQAINDYGYYWGWS